MATEGWLAAFLGGMMIGLATVIMLLFNGRVTGNSGIISQAFLNSRDPSSRWTRYFVIGLFAGAFVYRFLHPFEATVMIVRPMWIMILAGLLVGYGTRLGSGCTSGHGICGMARFSKRSILATLTFMGTAFLTVMIYNVVFILLFESFGESPL